MPDIADIKTFILHHQAWAGLILALSTYGESLVLVGLFIPATALMILTGTLIAHDVLNPVTVFIWCIIGAILGDATSYWIGRWIGPSVVRRWPFNQDRTAIAQARLFFRKYGFLSIFIGRFLGPIRSTIPLVAGMMRMGHFVFQVANVTSAIAWVPFMLLLGYLPAKRIGDLDEISSSQWIAIVIGVLTLTVAFTAVGFIMQRRRSRERRQRRTPVPAQ